MTVCRFFSQNLFNGFGNGISSQHVSLWCPDARISDDKELLNIVSNKRCNRFFNLPGTPPAQMNIGHGLMPSNVTPNRECFRHALPSLRKVHCGVVQQADWGEASSMTENSSWYSDSSRDTTEPWVARTYAWEDLGDRMGLPEDYCRPPIGEVKRPLHDLVIPSEFGGKSHTEEMLLEIHEVDLIEDSLRALSGIDSTIFRRLSQSATFQLPGKHRLKLRNTTVSATLSILKVFCKAGTTLMRLELLAIYYSQDSSRGGKTLQAMGDALQLYLSTHRAFVERITQQCLPSSKMDQADEVVSVTKLVCKTRKLCSVLEFVGHVFGCDEDVFWPLLQQGKFPHGVALLNRLHHHVSSLRVEDAAGHIHELAIWFLVKACSPVLAAISDLISSGRVDQATDPFDEFRITTWSRHLLEQAAVGGGDGLFSDDLSADAIQMLPAFLKNVAPVVAHLSQVQALLRSINAITSTHPLVNMQPLSIYTCSDKATEHAEEWQSVFAEVIAYREDITLSTETRKSTSKLPFEAKEEQRQCFVPEDVNEKRSSKRNRRTHEEANEAEADQEACGRGGFLNEYLALMTNAEDRIDSAKANEEIGAWTLAPRSEGGSSMKLDEEAESRSETSTDNSNTRRALVEVHNVLENCRLISANNDAWRASGKVNTQSGSHSFGIFKSPASTVMASRKTCVRILNKPGGMGASMYETLYGGSDEMPTPKDKFRQNGADDCVAASMTDDVGMEESSQVVDTTTDSMPKEPRAEVTVDEDVQMQDVLAHDEERYATWRSDCGERLSSKTSGYVGEVRLEPAQVSLPPIHPFFSMAVSPEDSEVLTRALTENAPEADFTSFSSIVNSCVEIPVRLVSQKLEQVAVDWFRNSLQVLEHLRWLRKLMLMSEGHCMDIFARDFLRGLSSTTRVNWGADDRLSSALTLAMIEGSVSMNVMTPNFHYKTTAALSRVLTSLTMTPAVPTLLNELELVYGVKWPLEMWGMLRTIRQTRKLSPALERLCRGAVYKMQAFLRAFNEMFATKVLMSAWSELEYALKKATTLTELRRCHEEYVSVALCCCFLDMPVMAIGSAISATLAAAWKLTGFIRGWERQAAERASDDSCMRALCGQLDVSLVALLGCLQNVARDAEQNTRKFSECLLLRLNFNQYYSTEDIPIAVSASVQRDSPRS
ncbi:unnamed protein product [Peronospora destructor]|uniref:Spindle pole body component n=1 Tax=Peronospora destructor TaxID=86335 RepID=A0AAV0T4D4_9STRA|nr:unnamed protein product [Peronospora destructor]